MAEKRKYDSIVARMAGNIAAGMCGDYPLGQEFNAQHVARTAVEIARAIVAEIERTEADAPAGVLSPPEEPK